jgi:hypothetical protein
VRLPVFPVRIVWTGKKWDKLPCIAEWRTRASTDPAAWSGDFRGSVRGIELGQAGLVVVDADRHGGPDGVEAFAALGEMPPHPVIRTPSGFHHYFRQPEPPINGKRSWRPGIDLLGVGRFAVAPGSMRPDGARWEGRIEEPIPVLPSWIAEEVCRLVLPLLERPIAVSRGTTSTHGPGYARAALQNNAREIETVPTEGDEAKNGHDTIWVKSLKMGGMVARGWITEPEIVDAFLDAVSGWSGLTPSLLRNIEITIRQGIERGMNALTLNFRFRSPFQLKTRPQEFES